MTVSMKRVIWHWTAGARGPIDMESDSYHEIVQPDGTWEPGTFRVEANAGPLRPGQYAAHTLNCNTGSIGIACDAMAFAQERPFLWGSNPLTWPQIHKMLERTAVYCRTYGIPVSRQTTLSHAEVQPTLGIRQRNKWDIAILPGMDRVEDPVVVGDELRRILAEYMQVKPVHRPVAPPALSDIEAALADARSVVGRLEALKEKYDVA